MKHTANCRPAWFMMAKCHSSVNQWEVHFSKTWGKGKRLNWNTLMSSGAAGRDERSVSVGECSLCCSWEGRAAPTPAPACFISQAESILCPACEVRNFLCGCSGVFLLIQALCLTSGCSWARVEKLKLLLHLCCFPRWAMGHSAASLLSLPCGHSAMPRAGHGQPGAASVLTVTSAASSSWLSMHQKDNDETSCVQGNTVHDMITSDRVSCWYDPSTYTSIESL